MLLLFAASHAHEAGHAKFAVTVTPASHRVETVLTCAVADVVLAARAASTAGDPASVGAYLDERIAVTNDGAACTVLERELSPPGDRRGFWYLKTFECTGPLAHLELKNTVFTELGPESSVLGRIQVGEAIHAAVFTARRPTFALDLVVPEPPATPVLQFVTEGLWHILGGWDHVLFVVALVLLARRVRELLTVVTAFTVAHSITLACSALDVFTVPAAVIEPVIALSIVWMAAEAALGRVDPRRAWLAAFALGLVHGFGFSYVLRDTLELPTRALVPALLAFNVGVELGQLCIVGALFPLRHGIRDRPWERKLVVTIAVVIGSIALWWFVERLLA